MNPFHVPAGRRTPGLCIAGLAAVMIALPLAAQMPKPKPASRRAPAASTMKLTLGGAIRLALAHNHALQAEYGNVLESEADQITANMRPNPTLTWDALYVPIFSPSHFSTNFLNQVQEFDVGLGYTWERGGKRQKRLAVARQRTAVQNWRYQDAERGLKYAVARQFIAALLAQSSLRFARRDLKAFRQSLGILRQRYRAGAISEGDYLKIKLQSLQFQSDVARARLALAQARAGLRPLLGGPNAAPRHYQLVGHLHFHGLRPQKAALELLALRKRPDYQAARQSVREAESRLRLSRANGKQDLSWNATYTHVGGVSEAGFTFGLPLPFFNRNQGGIERSSYAIAQARQAEQAAGEDILAQVRAAYAGLRSRARIARLYQSYLPLARQSLTISAYAYQRGATSLLNFLDAERSYRNVQLAMRAALANYMLALEQVRAAVGTRHLP